MRLTLRYDCTVADPPPMIWALRALGPITATDPDMAGSSGSKPLLATITVPAAAASRNSARSSGRSNSCS